MGPDDVSSVGEGSRRSGFAPPALRCYERRGLLSAARTGGAQRRYERIGCGCLSLRRCAIANPSEVAAARGSGAVYLPRPLTVADGG